MATTDTPRAWVGCLGCYNNGDLNGKWADGTETDPVEIGLAVLGPEECSACDGVGEIVLEDGKGNSAPPITCGNCGGSGNGYRGPFCKRCHADEFWVFDHENYQ